MSRNLILAFESSADDCCVSLLSVLASKRTILLNLRASANLKRHMGIHPLESQIHHQEKLPFLLKEAVSRIRQENMHLDLVASTRGPGMNGCLQVGYLAGQSVALAFGVPFIAVNHLHGHLLTPLISHEMKYPNHTLLVTGKHSQVIRSIDKFSHTVVCDTLDIAVGDYLDKLAKLYSIDPTTSLGAAFSEYAVKFPSGTYDLPRPLSKHFSAKRIAFSFSGLLTEVTKIHSTLTDDVDKGLLASDALKAGFDHLLHKTSQLTEDLPLYVSGGVASNSLFKEMVMEKYPTAEFTDPGLCTDNAAMIANAGWEIYNQGYRTKFGMTPIRSWPIEHLLASPGGGAMYDGGVGS